MSLLLRQAIVRLRATPVMISSPSQAQSVQRPLEPSRQADHRHALAPGSRVGDYRIERFLGSGGFGITYLAIDETLGRRVAIKEYLPSDWAMRDADGSVVARTLGDRDDLQWGLERFAEEARSLARFNHPNIVHVHRYFAARATGFLVMEYVDGESLGEMLRRKGALTEAETRTHVLPILDGLETLHDAGLLHRDIKPDNIVLRSDGTPVLVDFGAARQQVGARSRSVTSLVTPHYSPWEQYSTNAEQGPATDLYAFAAVLHRCVTGSPPQDAADRSLAAQSTTVHDSARTQYDARFLLAIDAALAIRAEDRPQSVAEFHALLAGTQSPKVVGGFLGRTPQEQDGKNLDERHNTDEEPAAVEGQTTEARPALNKLVLVSLAIVVLGVIMIDKAGGPEAWLPPPEAMPETSVPQPAGRGSASTSALESEGLGSLNSAIDRGIITIDSVISTGGSSGDVVDAVLVNLTPTKQRILVHLATPLFLRNRGSAQDMVVTQVYSRDGTYWQKADGVRYIEVPAAARLPVTFIAYCADFDRANPSAGDAFDLAPLPQRLSDVSRQIVTYETASQDNVPTKASQLALWVAQGETLDAIRERFEFDRDDTVTMFAILGMKLDMEGRSQSHLKAVDSGPVQEPTSATESEGLGDILPEGYPPREDVSATAVTQPISDRPASASALDSEGLASLNGAIDRGSVTIDSVTSTGGASGSVINAVLVNLTPMKHRIEVHLASPLFLRNRGATQDMIVTQVYGWDDGTYWQHAHGVSYIEIPAAARLPVTFIAYSVDFDKADTSAGDAFDVAPLPQRLSDVSRQIVAYETANRDDVPRKASQLALWVAQGNTLDAIRERFEFDGNDVMITFAILEVKLD